MIRWLLGSIAVLLVTALGCGTGTGPSDQTWTVSGSLAYVYADDGVLAYVALMTMNADSSMTPVYIVASNPFSDGGATYTLPNVSEGTYYFGAFIDMNGNVDPDNPSPDGMDYVNADWLQITVDENVVANISEWEQSVGTGPGGDVYGTLTRSWIEDGTPCYVSLTPTVPGPSPYAWSGLFADGWADYVIFDVEANWYTFSALIDVDGDADVYSPQPDSGDLVNSPFDLFISCETLIDVHHDDWIPFP